MAGHSWTQAPRDLGPLGVYSPQSSAILQKRAWVRKVLGTSERQRPLMNGSTCSQGPSVLASLLEARSGSCKPELAADQEGQIMVTPVPAGASWRLGDLLFCSAFSLVCRLRDLAPGFLCPCSLSGFCSGGGDKSLDSPFAEALDYDLGLSQTVQHLSTPREFGV